MKVVRQDYKPSREAGPSKTDLTAGSRHGRPAGRRHGVAGPFCGQKRVAINGRRSANAFERHNPLAVCSAGCADLCGLPPGLGWRDFRGSPKNSKAIQKKRGTGGMSSPSAAAGDARPAPASKAAALRKLCAMKCASMDLKCQITAFNSIRRLEECDGGKHRGALLGQGYSQPG